MPDTPAEHPAYCRRMAMDAYDLAERAEEPEVIAAYMEIAARWLRLAELTKHEAQDRRA